MKLKEGTEPVAGWIGRRLRRREDLHLLLGRGRYAADLHPDGVVHVAFRRARIPEADRLRVDVSAALDLPGVVGAWTAGQLGLADALPSEIPGLPAGARGPLRTIVLQHSDHAGPPSPPLEGLDAVEQAKDHDTGVE